MTTTYEVRLARTGLTDSIHSTREEAEARLDILRQEYPDETFHIFGFRRQ